MKKNILLLFLFLSALTLTAQEIQVPMDLKGEVEFIDNKLEKKLNLFSEYEGLKEAWLFQSSDSTYVLDITYHSGDKLLKVRKLMTENETMNFREKVTAAIRQQAPEIELNQEGRTRLLTWTTAVGLGYYGWAVPTMLDVNEGKAFTGLYMLSSGAGFFIPYSMTKNRKISDADAVMSIYGQTRGIAHGLSLAFLMDENAGTELQLGMGILAGIAEGIAGYKWSDRMQMTEGKASLISAMGDFGLGIGAGTAHFTGLLNDDNSRILSSSLLFGSAAGIASGVMLSKSHFYTQGDAFVLRDAGVLGAYVAFAGAVVADPSDDKVYSAMATLGSIGGIAIGHKLAKENDFTTGQGIFVGLSELAGGLIGLGTGYLLSPGSEGDEKLIVTTSALGAIGGFALMTNRYSKKVRVKDKAYSLNVNLNPFGIMELAKGNVNSTHKIQAPVFSASLRF